MIQFKQMEVIDMSGSDDINETLTNQIEIDSSLPLINHCEFEKASAMYMVVNLQDGTIDYLNAVPSGGWTDEYKTQKLVLRRIEAGSFMMGSNSGDYDEKPVHKVTLTKPFYIGVFQVTQAQWWQVMGNNPSCFDGDTLPVEQVSYDDIRGKDEGARWPASAGVDAGSFMGKLRALTKRNGKVQGFDLPTEAQWECACRAGTVGDYNGTGNLDDMGWYSGNSGDMTHPVGMKRANAWGLFDTYGNVWEWCLDWFDNYDGGDITDPNGDASGWDRVYRGGGWYSNACNCRSAIRDCSYPGDRGGSLGFRLACSSEIN